MWLLVDVKKIQLLSINRIFEDKNMFFFPEPRIHPN